MTRKAGTFDEDAPDPEPASFGAVMAPDGVMSVVPRPLGVGRPKPEPEEHWTLGPGRHEPAAEGAAQAGPPGTDTADDRKAAEGR